MDAKRHNSMGAPPATPGKEGYFSQHGEDFLLETLFDSQEQGFFVEIGCIDGLRFSNSLRFELNGWKGLCVEAHADYIEPLRRNRPNSIVEHAAVGEKDAEEVTFYANSRGSLSTLDKGKESEFERYGEYFTGFETQKVPMLTLNTIFRKRSIHAIDFLSLDIEGYEVQALRGIDFSEFRPTRLVIESDSREHADQIEAVLKPAGYVFVTSLGPNLFYSLIQRDRKIIHRKVFRNVPITHTRHPLDNTTDKTVNVDIATGKGPHRRGPARRLFEIFKGGRGAS